jgi:hypothetical protein
MRQLRSSWVLAVLLVLALVAAGCMEPSRNIDNEAKERERFARDNNQFDVVAVLSGPATIAPGALVWYSAYGSHDPDFLGATQADLRDDEPDQQGTVQYRDNVNEIQFSWYMPMYDRSNEGLGTGIRTYEWQVDDGPVLHSYDLTHRYGSEDGPIRFPLGFTEPGEHTLRLTVIGWDGSRDHATMQIRVAEGGTGSTVGDWAVTEEGWVHNRTTELEPHRFGECPPLASSFDPATHRVQTPWDLVYWMDTVQVQASWPPTFGNLQGTLGGALPFEPPADVNTADVELTLGHCNEGDVWKRIDDEPGLMAEEPTIEGSASGQDFTSHMSVDGMRTDKTATWHWNAFHSNSGTQRGGVYTPVDVSFVFVPATDTRAGGL